jgi:5-methylcytosine-specific restriction endonuclease McrA
MSIPLILRLDVHGQPVSWIPWQEAACIYVRERVAWTAGGYMFALHGGHSRLSGEQSRIEIKSIIAVKGESRQHPHQTTPPLSNRELFRRDRYTCLYCGYEHRESLLTRDHVKPLSRGGRDHWRNVVTACRRCNTRKGNRSPEQAGMPLLAIPYVPNLAEYLVLRNRRILVDQMEFLRMQFHQMDKDWQAQ